MEQRNWKQLAATVSGELALSDTEQRWLEGSDVARLIGETPFLAGARNPDRTAVVNLSTLVLAWRRPEVFGHRPGDSIRSRLDVLDRFEGGDRRIIERSFDLLALRSLADHRADSHTDIQAGKRNPIVDDGLDVDAERSRLLAAIGAVPCPQMDEIMTPHTAWSIPWWCCIGDDDAKATPAETASARQVRSA